MSSFSPTQFVLIDDTDPRIQYNGQWTQEVQGATDGWGIYGPAHNRTLMRTTDSTAGFTFKFNGTGIAMEGSIDTLDSRPRPSWSCSIDNRSTRDQQADENNRSNLWPICNTDNTGAGEHTFKFQVTVPSGGAFWFDRLRVTPSETILAGETMYVSDDDPSVSYSPSTNFNRSGDIVHLTDIAGSSVTLKFTGISASLFSIYEANRPDGKGHYSIDGQPPVPFNIPGHKDVNARFNQELFRISDLSPTNHTVVATFDGQSGDTPLNVDYFYVTLPPKNTTETGSTTGPSQNQTSDKHSTPVGPIVGGVIGGVTFLALVLVGVFLLRRRRRSHPELEAVPYEDKPTAPAPFTRASYQLAPQSEANLLSTGVTSYDPYATQSAGVAPMSVVPSTGSAVSSSEPSTTRVVQKQQEALQSWNQTEQEVHVVHVDSGLRLTNPNASGSRGPRVVNDIPPQYTEN